MNFERPTFQSPAPESKPPEESVFDQPLYAKTDQEVIADFHSGVAASEAQMAPASHELLADSPILEIGGKRLQVDAYTDAWREKALKYRENPAPVEKQLDDFVGKLELLMLGARQTKEKMARLRQMDAQNEGALTLTPEVDAQISSALLPFQPFYENEAVIQHMEQSLEEVNQLIEGASKR